MVAVDIGCELFMFCLGVVVLAAKNIAAKALGFDISVVCLVYSGFLY